MRDVRVNAIGQDAVVEKRLELQKSGASTCNIANGKHETEEYERTGRSFDHVLVQTIEQFIIRHGKDTITEVYRVIENRYFLYLRSSDGSRLILDSRWAWRNYVSMAEHTFLYITGTSD